MNEKIETLALEKDFIALSAAERAWVLAEMSQLEYEHLHAVLTAARRMDEGLLPPYTLKTQLLNQMAAHTRPSLMGQAISVRIPVWLAAASVLLAVILVSFLKKTTIEEKIVRQITVKTDTIWQEKTVWRTRTVVKETVVFRDKPAAEPVASMPEERLGPELQFEFTQPEFSSSKMGTSLGDAPELMRFFTQGDQ